MTHSIIRTLRYGWPRDLWIARRKILVALLLSYLIHWLIGEGVRTSGSTQYIKSVSEG